MSDVLAAVFGKEIQERCLPAGSADVSGYIAARYEKFNKTTLERIATLEAQLADRDAQIAALRKALTKIAYEPVGEPTATDREVLNGITEIARAALSTPASIIALHAPLPARAETEARGA